MFEIRHLLFLCVSLKLLADDFVRLRAMEGDGWYHGRETDFYVMSEKYH